MRRARSFYLFRERYSRRVETQWGVKYFGAANTAELRGLLQGRAASPPLMLRRTKAEVLTDPNPNPHPHPYPDHNPNPDPTPDPTPDPDPDPNPNPNPNPNPTPTPTPTPNPNPNQVGVLTYEFSAGKVPYEHPEDTNPVYREHDFKDRQG